MARSQRLRFKDLRDVYLLVGECLELRVSPDAWNRHLIEGASRMVGAVGGVCIELRAPAPAQPPSRISFIDWEFDSPAHRKHWLRYMADGEFARNPLMPGMLQRARPAFGVHSRSELCARRCRNGQQGPSVRGGGRTQRVLIAPRSNR